MRIFRQATSVMQRKFFNALKVLHFIEPTFKHSGVSTPLSGHIIKGSYLHLHLLVLHLQLLIQLLMFLLRKRHKQLLSLSTCKLRNT